ncbi:hypothetical protein [Ferrimonas kyonanensis]|uniref:hypothetical protein n=1 Tax=Ferrimonas kyonanensis TaxID=364763 RepID=UPI0004291075|nr:hypothetical protein [Ferrimonas kyonanensis]
MAKWTDEQATELATLQQLAKPNPKQRARIKILEKLKGNAERQAAKPAQSKPDNFFSVQSTSKTRAYPVRYTENDHIGLDERLKHLKANESQYLIEQLGSMREASKAKLIRAAAILLNQHTDKEVIDAMALANLSMFLGQLKAHNLTTYQFFIINKMDAAGVTELILKNGFGVCNNPDIRLADYLMHSLKELGYLQAVEGGYQRTDKPLPL